MSETNLITNKIGDKLKAARKRRHLSQEEVSEKLLISRQSISKWENNICLPDLENFQKICELYEIDSRELLAQKKPDIEEETANTNDPADGTEDSNDSEITARPTAAQSETFKPFELNISYFLIPFFGFYFLIKGFYRIDFSKKTILLLLFNVIISIVIIYAVCCGIPITTTIPSSP